MDFAKRFIHKAAKHLGEPMVNSGEHAKECRYTHHNVEVSHHKISVVQSNVKGGVTEENTRQTT